jgi:magnesium transporter
MRVLTVFATIFIPLTFVAGIYGMNFDTEASPLNMPELGWAYGYPAFWGLMITVTSVLLVYFRRKGMLGGSGSSRSPATPGTWPNRPPRWWSPR